MRQKAESDRQGLQRDLEFEKAHAAHVEEVHELTVAMAGADQATEQFAPTGAGGSADARENGS